VFFFEIHDVTARAMDRLAARSVRVRDQARPEKRRPHVRGAVVRGAMEHWCAERSCVMRKAPRRDGTGR
jgi:hypothetical protein